MQLLLTLGVAVCILSSTVVASVGIDKKTLRWMRSKPPIDSIVVEGNVRFSDGDVMKSMYSRRRTFWSALKGDRRTRVQRESIGRDTLGIQFLYRTNGYLNVEVYEAVEPLLPDSTALVNVRIHEGRLFYYGPVTIKGAYPDRFESKFTESVKRLKQGNPISFLDLRRAGFDMKTILADKGYPYAEVTYQLDSSGGSGETPIRYRITSDSLVHFGDVSVVGSKRYPEYTARRELKIKPGEIYSRQAIIESNRRLIESGYFQTFSLKQPEESANRLRPDFLLRIRERKPVHLSFETGAGQSEDRELEWRISGGFGRRNFLGSRRYDLLSELSFSIGRESRLLNHNYRIRFTEPWFLGLRMPLILTARWAPGVKDPVQNYRIESWSLSAATSKWLGRRDRATVGVEYEQVNIFGVPEAEKELRKDENGITIRRKLYSTVRFDGRDDIFVPTRGMLVDLSAEYFGGFFGGDHSFSKLEASISNYRLVWPGWIMAGRLKGGWVQEFGETKAVPTDERLLIGGANSVRGFVESSLGPLRPDGSPEGASLILMANLEFRWKTFQLFRVIPILNGLFESMPLWQSVFFDIGNGFSRAHHFKPNNLAKTYGSGFQIISPAGPIRIDYARIIPTERFAFDYRWHFTILYAF